MNRLKIRRFLSLISFTMLVIFTIFFTMVFLHRPNFEKYFSLLKMPQTSQSQFFSESKMKVTFVGVTSLLFEDGETSFMTDGFFSRPGKWNVLLGHVSPNQTVITQTLRRLNVSSLAAVIPIHSHYDHALDSSLVAQNTNAMLIGSESTANIARSFGISNDQIRVAHDDEQIQLGKFRITFLRSAHSPRALFSGLIEQPFSLPARSRDFQMGDCYSLLIEHEGSRILVHGSAGYIPDALKNSKADVIYLGIGTLGMQSEDFKNSYWNEVVKATHARRIILVHWDDFFASLDEPLSPLGWPVDNFNESLDFLMSRGKNENVDVRIPTVWESSDPFFGLAPAQSIQE